MTEGDEQARSARRRTIGLLAFLFLAPVVIAFWMYYGSHAGRSSRTVNHGELISPARPLPEVVLGKADGTQAPASVFKGKWTLLYVGAGDCDADCRQALYNSRQVRTALNQDMDRVQRVFLYTGPCCEQPFFGSEHPDLLELNADSAGGEQLLGTFPGASGVRVTEARRLYLIDPLGNLMMSYPKDADAKGLLADLKRLLHLSHIG